MTEAVALWVHSATRVIRAPADALTWVRRIGYLVLALQLVGFLAWSTILYRRFALTFDFAVYHQAWYLVAHGNLDPYSSLVHVPFWRSDSEFSLWLLAPFYWIWPHNLMLLWLQDVSIIGAEAVSFTWMCELARRHCAARDAAWLAGAGLALLAANPWMWWSVSFDVHAETLLIVFAVLLARDLVNGRRRAWLWAVPLLIGSAPTATYVAALGLCGLLARRRTRMTGAAMALIGLAYSLLIVVVHADKGVSLAYHYGYLATGTPPMSAANVHLTFAGLVRGVASHPLRVLETLWSKRADIWANVAPAGALGVGFPAILPLVAVVLLENILSPGFRFAEPIFQAIPVYVLLPLGTVAVLGRLMRRRRGTALLLTGLLAAQAFGWAAVWAPRTAGQWLRVPGAAASTLAAVEARIPSSAEVIASQGVVGRFSDRADVHALAGPGRVPVRGDTWFVITPSIGVEIQSPASAMALIGELAGPLHATLVNHANGVWAFRWRPPPGVQEIALPDDSTPLPTWAAPIAPGTVGRSILHGPAGNWHVTSTGGRGYVADGLAWQEPPGRYQAFVTLSTTGPVNVEVWNDTGNVLLARQSLPATTGVESISLAVDAVTPYRTNAYSGWGPFRADFVSPPPGQRLEVRVWSPGGQRVNVYSAQLTPVSNGSVSQSRTLTGKS